MPAALLVAALGLPATTPAWSAEATPGFETGVPAPPAGVPPTQEPSQGAEVPPPGTTDDTLEEVRIVGERPGPGLWRVVNGDRTLYILGTLRPLPRKMVWKSREVEEVIGRSQLVIPERPDVDADLGPIKAVKLYMQWRKVRRNADGAALEDVLPADLYERFEALRATHAPRERDMLRLRPLLAAGELWDDSVRHAGLTLRIDIDERVRKLAKRSKVPVAEPRLQIDDPQGMLAEAAQIPLDAEITCMRATLDRLESDLSNARALAEAWATGDVDLIRSKAEWQHEQACWASLTSVPKLVELRRRFDEVWFDEAVRALETLGTTLAVAPLPTLLKPDGVLARLRALGYEVLEP